MRNVGVAACTALVVCLFTNAGLARAQAPPAPWASADIGSPALAGGATLADGIFQIDAAGADIWGTSDQFHFVYQVVSGDVDIRARVDSLTAAHRATKAGVMIRSSLAANALHGSAFVSVAKGSSFQRRVTAGGLSTASPGPMVTAPRWLRVVRTGSLVTGYQSTDGTDWVEMGRDTVGLGATVYVGIAVSSVNTGMRTTAGVSRVVLGAPTQAPSLELPPGQAAGDIGYPTLSGSTTYSNGVYTLRSAGQDIWDGADQFHYLYQPVSGDMDVVARISSLSAAREWSKAGIMIRESLDRGSPHATAMITGRWGYALQSRPYAGAWSDHQGGGSGGAPGWLRLVRTGSQIEGFRSADGRTWVSMGTVTIPMDETVLVGLAVSSIDTNAYTTAVVDRFTVTQASSIANKPPSVVISSPAGGTTLPAGTAVAITATASDPDGSIAAVAFYANGTPVGRDSTAPYTASVPGLAAGAYALTALATDNAGMTTLSSAVTITVAAETTTSAPKAVAFTMSADHASLVSGYVLEIHAAGTDTSSAAALASLELGKPAPDANGEIVVDCSAFFEALASGHYQATVIAEGSSGSGRSDPVSFSR